MKSLHKFELNLEKDSNNSYWWVNSIMNIQLKGTILVLSTKKGEYSLKLSEEKKKTDIYTGTLNKSKCVVNIYHETANAIVSVWY